MRSDQQRASSITKNNDLFLVIILPPEDTFFGDNTVHFENFVRNLGLLVANTSLKEIVSFIRGMNLDLGLELGGEPGMKSIRKKKKKEQKIIFQNSNHCVVLIYHRIEDGRNKHQTI